MLIYRNENNNFLFFVICEIIPIFAKPAFAESRQTGEAKVGDIHKKA